MTDDRTLLERYRHSDDVEAFAELVGRYGGLVYGTAMRVTGNAHDAEDVMQESFLALAREAPGAPRSLTAWLHRVAVNRATNLVRDTSRRRNHEHSAADRRCPTTGDSRRAKLDSVVDEELDGLPEKLREPLIMHFFQERTQGEIAERIGMDQSTVSRHIQAGLEQLRKRLSKTGIAVTTAALALFFQESAAVAAPSALVAALGKTAATGIASMGTGTAAPAGTATGTAGGTGAVAATATAATGGIGIVKLSLIGLAAATAITTAVVVTQGRGQESDVPEIAAPVVAPAEKPQVVAETNLPDVTYAGVVVDIEGNPIEGVLVRSTWGWEDLSSLVTTPEGETRTDAEGRFVLGPLADINRMLGSRELFLLHPDYGIGGLRINASERADSDNLRIALTDPTEIAGRVTDEEGRPIAGASVSATLQCLQWCTTPPYDRIWSRADNEGYVELCEANALAVTTDEAGRFRFRNLPKGVRAEISARHPDYQRTTIEGSGSRQVFPVRTGDEALEVVMKRGCKIVGRLTENGRPYPLEGVPVGAGGGSGNIALTDDAGHFEITGLEPGAYTVYAALPFGAAAFPCQPKTDVVVALDEPAPEIELERAEPIPVSGHFINTAGNAGMPDKVVSASLILEGKAWLWMTRTVTDANGAYRMALPPGRYTFSSYGYNEGKHRTVKKTVEISRDSSPATVDLTGEFRPLVTGHLVDSNSRPVQGTIEHLGPETVTTDREGRFEIQQGRPFETVCFAFDTDKQLGRTILWKPGQNELEITLLPVATMTCTVEDENGKPIPDAEVALWLETGEGSMTFHRPPWNVEWNAEGEFRIHPIPLGTPLGLRMSRPGQETINREIGPEELKPGEMLWAGTAILPTPDKEYTAMLSGRLVDADGAPVIGVDLRANGGGVYKEDASDLHGRFVFGGLPVESQVAVEARYHVVSGRALLHEFRGLHTGRDDYVLPMLPPGYEWENTPAPQLQVERWLKGKPLTLKQLKGNVVMLVTAMEQRRIKRGLAVDRLVEEYKADAFTLIGLHIPESAVKYKNTKTKLEDYFEETTFPVALDVATDDAPFGATHAALGATLEGALVLIDKRGNLRYLLLQDDPALPDRINELLQEPLDPPAVE